MTAMLRQLFKGWRNFAGRTRQGSASGGTVVASEDHAALDSHLAALFGSTSIGRESYANLFVRCAAETGTRLDAPDLFRWAQGGINLAHYFVASLDVPGQRVECGVFRGLNALLMCHAARAVEPNFDGAGMHLFDSFEPQSSSAGLDASGKRDARGTATPPAPAQAQSDAALVQVQRGLAEFTGLDIRQGSIPALLHFLSESAWSFVHLDVGLYGSTLAGLEYFCPRLSPGAIVIAEGYDASTRPGARKAWDQFCGERDLSFIVLGTGQAVIIRD